MIDRDTLIACAEGSLADAEREKIERTLEADADSLRQLVWQKQTDQALRTFPLKTGARQHGRRSLIPIIYADASDPPIRIVSAIDGAVLDEVRMPETLRVDLRPRQRLLMVYPFHC